MGLLKGYLQSELRTMLKNDIRLYCLGEQSRLPADVQAILQKTISDTQSCRSMTLNLALNYGGRSELVQVMRSLAQKCRDGAMKWQDISEATISEHLFTAGQPDPDLLIRTGGENRLSNFLIWQASYTELYFTEVKWPDFKKDQFMEAISIYNRRQRRFGKTGAQL
jgi:undecaprenyl diphosphate synthase